MKIANLFTPDDIQTISSDKTKAEVFELLLNQLISSNTGDNFEPGLENSFLDKVLQRDKQSNTALGHGIAFPHARIEGLNRPAIAMGLIKDGINFNAPDGQDVKLVFLFLFPANRHDLGVKIQAVFARFLMQNDCITKILTAASKDEVYQLIKDAELAIDTPITAQDLMRNAKIKLPPETPLPEATALMHKMHTEVAPVLDIQGRLMGEIECIHLFQRDLPDYIKELNSVPPIHDFNPFNKYFADHDKLTVSEAINTNIAKVSLDASLMEIIFLLAVKKYSIVHVCDSNDMLVGVIDRITVLDKVFNL